jgi:ribonuclease VapC
VDERRGRVGVGLLRIRGTGLILDSSAVVAVICREPGYEELLSKIALARFLAEIQAMVIPFGRNHISIFFDAFRRYGKGRHPARLNMGDCFTYAVATAAGMQVLHVGNDFSQTDLQSA